ncbi:neuroguidin isoform X1 [Columba livia]|uniref:neuroguidin isoform X1 n=1 Tax=Columba livia TaxID=8932 RepID=UPI0031BB0907
MAEAAALLRALSEQVSSVAAHGRETLRRVRSGRLATQKGLAVLELRAQGLLQYLGDLALLLGRKTAGKALGGAEERARLLETRVVLEKLRPLERRLRYHVEKLLRAAVTGGRDANDPLSFRPRPTDMAATQEEEEEAAAAKAPGLGGGKRYVPPRLVPVTYDSMGQPPKRLRLRGALLGPLGHSWVPLPNSWVPHIWVPRGTPGSPIWVPLGHSWVPRGTPGSPIWVPWGTPGSLPNSWVPYMGPLGHSWVPPELLGPLYGSLGALLGPSRTPGSPIWVPWGTPGSLPKLLGPF